MRNLPASYGEQRTPNETYRSFADVPVRRPGPIQGVALPNTILGGTCDCCPGCSCYPATINKTTDCAVMPCLYKRYKVVGNLPFSGNTALAHDSGCTFLSSTFPVKICKISYGNSYWQLVVGSGTCGSVLTLVASGSASTGLNIKYKIASCVALLQPGPPYVEYPVLIAVVFVFPPCVG